VTATLLYSLGLPVPADFEGSVPTAMFTHAHRLAYPVVVGSATRGTRQSAETETMSADEKAKIMDQLQMLGYME